MGAHSIEVTSLRKPASHLHFLWHGFDFTYFGCRYLVSRSVYAILRCVQWTYMQAITYLITQVTESVRATLDVEGPS